MSGAATEVAGARLTSPARTLTEGVTKRDLAEHFARVAERMLPHVQGRALTFVRCPDGLDGDCFFQKHARDGGPAELARVEVEEKDGPQPYYAVRDAPGLVAVAQLSAIEVHIGGARASAPDEPDRMVFDLDPGEGVTFDQVVEAARDVRERLRALSIDSAPLLTGGAGIHVVVALERRHALDEVRAFARGLAARMREEDPERYVDKADKSARAGKVFVDYLRNGPGATAIAPYSPRARPRMPVATPVRWDELGRLERSAAYPIGKLARRLGSLAADPWGGHAPQRLSESARRALGAA